MSLCGKRQKCGDHVLCVINFMGGLNKLHGKRVEEMVDGRDFKVLQEGKEICRTGARVCGNEDVDMVCQMCMSAVGWWTVRSRSKYQLLWIGEDGGVVGVRRRGGGGPSTVE